MHAGFSSVSASPAFNSLLPGSLVIFGNFRPVDDVPDRFQIVGAAILVFEIIGVLPNVHAEHRFALAAGDGLAHSRIVLVGG